ncbi:MAG TPA: hypothetical protein VHT97_12675 [Acidimicrobiales bacterium]|nr:hypothetical protein [Acidimicrobiales bacterium]
MRVDAGRTATVLRLVDGRPRTSAIVAGGVEVAVEADAEIALVIDGRRLPDTALAVSEVTQHPNDGGLSWVLTGPHLSVRVVVAADRDAGVVRTHAEVTGQGRLQAVELQHWRGPRFVGFETTGEPVAYNAGPPGLGQPVFGPGFFAGIEHPVAENLVTAHGTGSACTLPLAVDLGTEPCVTPAAIVGAGGLDEFWDYLDTVRAVPARLVTLTNNWYHLGATGLMDEATVAAELAGFADVAADHDLALDFVCLDDGWEGEWDDATGLWGRAAPSKFPLGLTPPAQGAGPGIGLWLSPFGGYGGRREERVAWAGAHGLEVERAAGVLCPAGARYRAHLVDVLARWTAAGVGYWKLDGVRFVCAESDHGHEVGPGARTAQVDRFLDLVAGIRAVRADAVVAFTIGSHPSPWWLRAVDFVWRGGLDDAAAEHPGSRLDRFDTYVDTCLQAYRRSALPVSAVVTFSVVESTAASYREAGDLAAWERHCWMAVGRGTLHQDLYVAPDSLSEPEWDVLARALDWAARAGPVLARTRMVLGDPGDGEVYGFVGRGPGGRGATACLRNPSPRAQTVAVDWAELFGRPETGAVPVLDRAYGRAEIDESAGSVTLAPFDVLVLTVGTEPG